MQPTLLRMYSRCANVALQRASLFEGVPRWEQSAKFEVSEMQESLESERGECARTRLEKVEQTLCTSAKIC
jgi:hypothetical protein